ncbi:MAG: thiamine phosphate synthase, partial [Pseudomonadota bacterium]
IQRSETAVLINDDWQTAQAVHADGIHLSRADDVVARLTRAQQHLGKDMIIGVAGGMSRHEAMELGEAGASYLAWALTADSQDADEETEAERGAEMIRWWSSVFEVPAVAMFGLETTADVDIGASEFVEFTCSGDGAADCRAKADAIAAAFAKVSETALEPAS